MPLHHMVKDTICRSGMLLNKVAIQVIIALPRANICETPRYFTGNKFSILKIYA